MTDFDSAVELGFDYWRLVCIARDLNLLVMAPPSRSALINGYYKELVLNLRVLVPLSRLASIIGAWFVL